MILLGIDPGLSGAVCIWRDGTVEIHDMPIHALERGGKNKREIDEHALCALLSDSDIEHAFIERVWSMPGQGVSSSFAFGQSFGIIKGIIAAYCVPMTLVASMTWKKSLQVPAAKDGSRARASQLMPNAAHNWPLRKHDGRAEAALIALYGAQSLQRSCT